MNARKRTVNESGTPLGKNGYVLCRTCGDEVAWISRETPPEFAYCKNHKPNTGALSRRVGAMTGAATPWGQLMADIRSRAPLTREQVIEMALARGFPRKRATDAAWYAKNAGLVKHDE